MDGEFHFYWFRTSRLWAAACLPIFPTIATYNDGVWEWNRHFGYPRLTNPFTEVALLAMLAGIDVEEGRSSWAPPCSPTTVTLAMGIVVP